LVSAVNIGYGMQYPSLTINKLQIKVAPVWYLLDKNFEIKAGDPLVLLTSVGAVLIASIAAAFVPIRRAARIDPAGALRYD